MGRLPKMLVWHPTLGRFVGPGPAGLVITVGEVEVEAEYQDAYTIWSRAATWAGRRYWPEARCQQEATRAALSVGRYQVRIWPPRKRPRWPPPDIWLCHPANVPEVGIYLPQFATVADALPVAA